MIRVLQISLLLCAVLATPARAHWPESLKALCRFALLAPVKAVKAVVSPPSRAAQATPPGSEAYARHLKATQAMQNWYSGSDVREGPIGAHSFTYQIKHPDGRSLFAKVASGADSHLESGIAAREVEFLRRAHLELPEFASSFPLVVDSFPIVLDGPLPTPVVVLEKANRGTIANGLFEFRDYSPLKMAEAWMKISGPLSAVHSKWGFSHADIKPQNILAHVNAAGDLELKIADWGLYHDPSDPKAASGGTPAYQSLATLQGKSSPELDDVHGTKLVFLQMVTRKDLTTLHNAYPQAFQWVGRTGVPFWHEVPKPLRAGIAPALLEILETDYASIEQLHAAVLRARDLLRVDQ